MTPRHRETALITVCIHAASSVVRFIVAKTPCTEAPCIVKGWKHSRGKTIRWYHQRVQYHVLPHPMTFPIQRRHQRAVLRQLDSRHAAVANHYGTTAVHGSLGRMYCTGSVRQQLEGCIFPAITPSTSTFSLSINVPPVTCRCCPPQTAA